MLVSELDISALRNIDRLHLKAAPGINWIVGRNAAGKTSILESIFLLARGRSFRSQKAGPLLKRGAPVFGIQAEVQGGEGRISRVEYRQRRGDAGRWFENGLAVEGVKGLRQRLHVRIVADNAQRLLEGEPQIRRLFLDWNLFHVEPAYPDVLRQFRRVQAQRSAWLRLGGRAPAVWDDQYVQLAERLTEMRLAYLSVLQAESNQLRLELSAAERLRLFLSKGWPEGSSLKKAISSALDGDRRRGFTYYGPARADFRLSLGDSTSAPSRGEAKLLVCILQLAAQRIWTGVGGGAAVWLLDDLTSELDGEAASAVAGIFEQEGAQVFVTSVDGDELGARIFRQRARALFHVEQGRLSCGLGGQGAADSAA